MLGRRATSSCTRGHVPSASRFPRPGAAFPSCCRARPGPDPASVAAEGRMCAASGTLMRGGAGRVCSSCRDVRSHRPSTAAGAPGWHGPGAAAGSPPCAGHARGEVTRSGPPAGIWARPLLLLRRLGMIRSQTRHCAGPVMVRVGSLQQRSAAMTLMIRPLPLCYLRR